MEENFDTDDFEEWSDEPEVGPPQKKPNKIRNDNYNNERYSNAYGDYRGGYRMGGGGGGGYPPSRFNGPPPAPLGFGPVAPGPYRPGGMPRFPWGEGYGPNRPRNPNRRGPNSMEDGAIRYLIRCGVTKESVKNLPKDIFQYIDPEYCGLCGMSFDSFSVSRLHYVSKNHLKSQQKWINQQSERRYGKEVPMKSRDLYCELCDVHITSKVHADSHYSGKAHRAVVEGRKQPKNPILLQRGMEGRLAQLVRREKKFLKTSETDENAEERKEQKPIQPELYCDICKTSVTCSEQMTMHLNGKRHLAKEKQHILKMMKGEVAEASGDAEHAGGAETSAEQGAGGEGGAGEGAAGDTADNFDWGNGSGTWEEPTKTNT